MDKATKQTLRWMKEKTKERNEIISDRMEAKGLVEWVAIKIANLLFFCEYDQLSVLGQRYFKKNAREILSHPNLYIKVEKEKPCEYCHGSGEVIIDREEFTCMRCNGSGIAVGVSYIPLSELLKEEE